MSRPTVSQALAWQPEALGELAEEWDRAAGALQSHADTVDQAAGTTSWNGTAAQAARTAITPAATGLRTMCRALVLAAAQARDAAVTLGAARDGVLAVLAEAHAEGCPIADDGTAGPPPNPPELLVACAGGSAAAATVMLDVRCADLTRRVQDSLERLGRADADAARAIDAAFDITPGPAATRPAGVSGPDPAGWSTLAQDRIGAQIAALSPAEQHLLAEQHPHEVGNTDGVPWELRIAANRVNIATAILDERRTLDRPVEDKLRAAISPALNPADAERLWAVLHTDPVLRDAAIAGHDRAARQRIAYYETLIADVPDPMDPQRRIPRQILAFDPQRASLVELSGDLSRARAIAVLVPGLNTRFADIADDVATARRFVAGSGGDVAMISYLGGQFPTGPLLAGIADAADPHYAEAMAPRLVAFSEDVERRAGAIPVTVIGHSYGGSIVGTAERMGLTADRVIYVEAAGAGVGVHSPADWHNRNRDVLRFSMTAPGDLISAVQGIPFGPHGADPDEMPGVIALPAGRRLTGWPMVGPSTHSDVLTEPSDAWRAILAVITGDRDHIR
ncbi:alpha/beta hydrolase [Mycobacterium sp. M26]|uniref:alpha/beta hydrolase n=1 Tax=Mycobacterium sp. M26 TaxID=1762962 RepID=UPI00073EE08B|nr:alpha/beta hydrolase [Mycobacterium sp. M26]